MAKVLCGADITQIHKGAYCDRVMESSWSDAGASRRSQPGRLRLICKPKHKSCPDIQFSFHSSRLCSFPCGCTRRPASKPWFTAISAPPQHQWLIVALREQSAHQAGRIIRISGGKLGETAIHTQTHAHKNTHSSTRSLNPFLAPETGGEIWATGLGVPCFRLL